MDIIELKEKIKELENRIHTKTQDFYMDVTGKTIGDYFDYIRTDKQLLNKYKKELDGITPQLLQKKKR